MHFLMACSFPTRICAGKRADARKSRKVALCFSSGYDGRMILSVQSHVAYGRVGNRSAVFPLELIGQDVIAVNTVQFSNHTGYKSWRGQVFGAEHVRDVIQGIDETSGSIALPCFPATWAISARAR
jgi:hypothetical protein